tara:strand:+ start:7475 stop:7582 length:108 start_codon:yes stop_codon:yes gene_type:complete
MMSIIRFIFELAGLALFFASLYLTAILLHALAGTL